MSDETYWTYEALAAELAQRRGCVETVHKWRGGTIWLNNNGDEFTVPAAPDPRGYPLSLVVDILQWANAALITRHH